MLARLTTQGFRNLADSTWALGPGRHLFVGPNGAGKTSLLEAVYLACTTRSFRTAQLVDCCRQGTSGFRVEVQVEGETRDRLEVSWSAAGRRRALNGKEPPIADHLAVLPLVCWSLSEARVLAGPPALRRRLMDQMLVSLRPAGLGCLSRYARALQQKRVLLQRGDSGLEAWNRVLACEGSRIMAWRAELLVALNGALRNVEGIARAGTPPLTIQYRPTVEVATEGSLLAALDRAQREERRRAQALIGPHRDDAAIRLGDRELRRVASAGELKAAGLLVAAARGELLGARGKPALFLLDDLDAELDLGRLRALWRLFESRPQVLATSSRPAAWKGLDVTAIHHLEEGRAVPSRRPRRAPDSSI